MCRLLVSDSVNNSLFFCSAVNCDSGCLLSYFSWCVVLGACVIFNDITDVCKHNRSLVSGCGRKAVMAECVLRINVTARWHL